MRTGKFTRLLSLVLAVCMAFSVMAPVTSVATGTEITDPILDGEVVLDGGDLGNGTEGEDTIVDGGDLGDGTEGEDTVVGGDLGNGTEGEDTVVDGGDLGNGTDGEDTVVDGGDLGDGTEGEDTIVDGGDLGDGTEGEDTIVDGGDLGNGTEGEDIDSLDTQTEELTVTDYGTFLSLLKTLEVYADSYAALNRPSDPVTLVLNYIRTGVDKYMDSNWTTLAGPENTAFRDYVAEMDALNGTNVSALKNMTNFIIPNGQEVEFDHMFGTMNIAYVNPGAAGIGGWAGDICDLVNCVNTKGLTGTVEEMVVIIRQSHLGFESGIEGLSSFGTLDLYGDLDAYYIVTKIKAEGGYLSTWFESYFTSNLTNEDRAAFFLNNRFNGLLTAEEIREAVYSSYASDVSIQILEASRGIDPDAYPLHADLRKACCYAFADLMFEWAGDRLVANPEEPDDGEDDGDGDEEDGEDDGEEETPGFVYYTVFDTKVSTLAPGITQTINTAKTADNKNIVYYIATVDINRDDVSVHANYNENDPSKGWAMSKLVNQMAAAQARHSHIENYNTIVGVNADFFDMANGKPTGALVMEGVTYNPAGNEIFFAILDDGSAYIGAPSEWAAYADRVVEAVGANAWLVREGKSVVAHTDTYNLNRASRTCVGITADGQVVLMVLDGRQEPRSAGGSMQELAQIMLDAGCVTAVNLDGGGSTTFAAKQEGSDEVTVVNRPSDGFARSISSSLLVVSTAKISNEFYYAKLSTEYDYLTVNSSLAVTAIGVSGSGHSAEIPANAYWQVSDSTIGTVVNGVFTATGLGDVEVQLVVDGKVVGSKILHVVAPDSLAFTSSVINTVYGTAVELPLTALYNGNLVVFNLGDVVIIPRINTAGTVNGLYFTGIEASGIRTVTIDAALTANTAVTAAIQINLFKADEATFDFDNATAGDKTLAWNRIVENSMTSDNITYNAIVPLADMPISYTFALDMTEIGIPEKFNDIVYMLPAPDDGSNATAWAYLLSLAERVSVYTEVKVIAQFDEDLDIDISELTVSNDYFRMESAELDKTTNTLTIICKWIDQTESIPASTANPLCILSGIKAEAKDGASWDASSNLSIINRGEVSYDIYLRANALYTFAQKESNQEKYGLIPFEHTDIIINGATEKGAHYQAVYAVFEDIYTLNNGILQGWHQVGDFMHYYVNHEPVKNGIYKLPGFTEEDKNTELYYRFDENGGCIGAVTGQFELDGKKYYAFDGVLQTGWQVFDGSDGSEETYYFDPDTGAAVTGEQKIGGYNYVFEDYLLIKGQFITNSTGIRYVWAGSISTQDWFTVDGKQYYSNSSGYLATGIRTFAEEGVAVFYVFDETGAWMEDYTGFYEVPSKVHDYLYAGTCWVVEGKAATAYKGKDGLMHPYGLIFADGDYYYIPMRGVIAKGTTAYVGSDATNGLMPAGSYTFDNDGKMINTNVKNIYFYSDNEYYTALSVAVGATNITLPKPPIKVGYTFVKWDGIPERMPDANVTVNAVWKINQYTITFDTVGGGEVDSITADYGTKITAPAVVPTKVGYTFVGWEDLPETMPAKNVTVKAVWKAEQYTITLQDGYGNTIKTITQDYGTAIDIDSIDEPTTSMIGYTFGGWDTEIPETMPAESITIKATWKKAVYTITFNTDGGTEIEPITLEYGSSVPRPATPSKEGHRFMGWDTAIPSVMTGNLTITARWVALPYTITFNTDGGSAVASIRQNYGTAVTVPEAPTKTGYTFAGWENLPETVPAENITVRAKWTINQYTITFDTDGGSAVEAITQDYGTAVAAPETPTKEGYNFGGWTPKVPETMPAEDITVKATWNIGKYTIEFNTDGGTVIEPITDDYGAAITKPADPTKEGYEFVGWDKEIPETMPDEYLEIKAIWKIKQYTITFNTDGGSEVDAITADYGAAVTKPADPTNEGYTFDGWDVEIPETMPAENVTVTAKWEINQYTITFENTGDSVIDAITADFGTAVTKPADPTKEGYTFDGWDVEIPATMPAENVTITAKWEVNEYNVTWVVDGKETTEKVAYGAAITAPADPVKEGYTFDGWDVEIPATMPAEDVTFTAKWTVNTYTVKFIVDGETYEEVEVAYGEAIDLPENPEKRGYTFAGWDDLPETVPAENVTVTAKWTVNQYTITFAETGDSTIAAIKQDYGTAVTKPADPVKEGYKFIGWDIEVPETMPAKDLTITAKWEICEYTITFVDEDGTEITKITAAYGTAVTEPEAPTKEGYTFLGWDIEVPATMPAGDMTITAKWESDMTGWFEEDGSITYLEKGEKVYFDTWAEIEDKNYYFDTEGYALTGMQDVGGTTYIFEETGALSETNGLYNVGNDTYYVQSGAVVKFAGLVKTSSGYYYFGEDDLAVKNGTYNVVKTNGLLDAGEYKFNKNGVLMADEVVTGDLDGNMIIDNNDAIYLLYHTIFGEAMGYPLNQDCDFDGNGAVDNNDAIYLLYHTIFGDSMYPLG